MRGRSIRANARVAASLAILLALGALAASAPPAAAGDRLQAGADRAGAGRAVSEAAAVQRVLRYWTPERMREARPLGLVVGAGGEARLRLGSARAAGATASFKPISTPELLPYAVNGRIFIRQGNVNGYCSGTAIDSPTRQLVLTAGHCVNSGPEEGHPRHSVWSNYLQFVPAYTGGVAPFGAFVAKRGKIFAPRQWIKQGNPDFDLGAFLTHPNAEGVNLADAVGGGVTIALGISRKQQFQTFGYPGETTRMQGCNSPYIGDDSLTYPLPGPPTMGIRCRWAPGASGGGWLINEGTEVNGVNSYLHLNNKKRTYGPYFTQETVGKLVRGL
jgi:V8-like Glu-specific endopeptidase